MSGLTLELITQNGTRLIKNIRQGTTILEILLSENILIPHDCGGICSCSTCHIYVEAGNEMLNELENREKHFINKLPDKKDRSRLACQCIIQERKGKLIVRLPKITPNEL